MTAGNSNVTGGVIAIAGARRNVGRSTLAANLAVLFGDLGKQVFLVNLDPHPHAVEAVTAPRGGALPSALGGRTASGRAIIRRSPSLAVVSVPELAGPETGRPRPEDCEHLLRELARAGNRADFSFVLPPAGDGSTMARMIDCADATLLVITPEPKALSDTYSLLKTLSMRRHDVPLLLLVNMARGRGDAERAAQQIQEAARHYLRMHVGSVGFVPYDPAVERAAARGEWFVAAAPESRAARRLKRAARLVSRWLRNPGYSLATYFQQSIGIETPVYAAPGT